MSVETNIQITANIPLTDLFLGIAEGFLSFYKDPKFLACIVIAFMSAQLAHVLMRGYLPDTRDLTKALVIWTVHILMGAILAHNLLSYLPDVKFYRWFTGINSILLFYLLLWISTKWFKWPSVAQWLTLRKAKINSEGEVSFGSTIKFLKK